MSALPEGALAILARQAEGGMRDALSLLDQVRAGCRGRGRRRGGGGGGGGGGRGGGVAPLGGAHPPRRRGGPPHVAALHDRGLEMKRTRRGARPPPAQHGGGEARSQGAARSARGGARGGPRPGRGRRPARSSRASSTCAQRAVAEVKESEQPRYALEVALLAGVFLAPGVGVRSWSPALEALAWRSRRPQLRRGDGFGRWPGARGRAGSSGYRPRGPAGTAKRAPAAEPKVAAAPAGGSVLPKEPRDDPAARGGRALAAGWRGGGELQLVAANALKQAVLGLRRGRGGAAAAAGHGAATLEQRRAEVEAVFGRFFGRPVTGSPCRSARGRPRLGSRAAAPPPSLAAVGGGASGKRARPGSRGRKAHPNIQEAARILEGEVGRSTRSRECSPRKGSDWPAWTSST